MTFHNNCLQLNGKEIVFSNKIYNVMASKSYIFVLLGFDLDAQTHCNIYCLNQEGQEVWRIKKCESDGITKNMNNAYIGLRISEGKYLAVNFYNEVVRFNPFNGKII